MVFNLQQLISLKFDKMADLHTFTQACACIHNTIFKEKVQYELIIRFLLQNKSLQYYVRIKNKMETTNQ